MQRTLGSCDLATTTTAALAAAIGRQHPVVHVLPNSHDAATERAVAPSGAVPGRARAGRAGAARLCRRHPHPPEGLRAPSPARWRGCWGLPGDRAGAVPRPRQRPGAGAAGRVPGPCRWPAESSGATWCRWRPCRTSSPASTSRCARWSRAIRSARPRASSSISSRRWPGLPGRHADGAVPRRGGARRHRLPARRTRRSGSARC